MKIVSLAALLTATPLLPALSHASEAQMPQSDFVYKKTESRPLRLEMNYPQEWKPEDKRPAVVFFHGGGWTGGSPKQFLFQARHFSRRGLVCARAEYRLRGRDHITPADCVKDALSAMRWVRSHATTLGIDPNKIAAAGGSAGGHLAACSFFTEGLNDEGDDLSVSPRPNAMILYNPALDLTIEDPRMKLLVSEMDTETRKAVSPLLHIKRTMPPTLLLDGTEDFLYSQIKAFVEKGKALGAPVEVFWAEGQGHAFFNREPWLEKTTQRADAFLVSIEYLKESPKSVPSEKSD